LIHCIKYFKVETFFLVHSSVNFLFLFIFSPWWKKYPSNSSSNRKMQQFLKKFHSTFFLSQGNKKKFFVKSESQLWAATEQKNNFFDSWTEKRENVLIISDISTLPTVHNWFSRLHTFWFDTWQEDYLKEFPGIANEHLFVDISCTMNNFDFFLRCDKDFF